VSAGRRRFGQLSRPLINDYVDSLREGARKTKRENQIAPELSRKLSRATRDSSSRSIANALFITTFRERGLITPFDNDGPISATNSAFEYLSSFRGPLRVIESVLSIHRIIVAWRSISPTRTETVKDRGSSLIHVQPWKHSDPDSAQFTESLRPYRRNCTLKCRPAGAPLYSSKVILVSSRLIFRSCRRQLDHPSSLERT